MEVHINLGVKNNNKKLSNKFIFQLCFSNVDRDIKKGKNQWCLI